MAASTSAIDLSAVFIVPMMKTFGGRLNASDGEYCSRMVASRYITSSGGWRTGWLSGPVIQIPRCVAYQLGPECLAAACELRAAVRPAARRVVETAEFGAYPVSIGVGALFEERQGLVPRGAGSADGTGSGMGFAEVFEHICLVEVATQALAQFDRASVTGNCLPVLAKLMVGVAEAVQGLGFAELVTDLPVQFDGALAVADGLLALVVQGVHPANRVVGKGLVVPVTGGLEQLKGTADVAETFALAVLLL